MIATYAVQFSQKATNLTIAGALALILTTVLLMQFIDQVINEIWMMQAGARGRHFSLLGGLSFGPLLLAGGVVLASAMLPSLSVVSRARMAAGGGPQADLDGLHDGPLRPAGVRGAPLPRECGACAAGGFLTAVGLVGQRLLGLYLVHFRKAAAGL